MKTSTTPALQFIVKAVIISAFLLSGGAKLISPGEAAQFIRTALHVQSVFAAAAAVYLLSVLELCIGAALMNRRFSARALSAGTILLLLFTAMLIYVSQSGGGEAPCGCFGPVGNDTFTVNTSILKNVVLLGLISLMFNERNPHE